MASLYDRLGGEEALDAAIPMFYRKVLGDIRVKRFFEDVDMNKLSVKMKNYLTMALRGSSGYNPKNMRDAHSRLVDDGLADAHFDIVVEHLSDTLKKLGVLQVDVEEVVSIVESTRDDVLRKH